MSGEHNKYGLSEEYWERIGEAERAIYRIVRPLRNSTWKADYALTRIEAMVADFDNDARTMGGQLELNPDFQRGHVWTQEKQVAYIENLFRGVAPRNLRFNCPSWEGKAEAGDMNPADIVCIDGLQRLTAVREFMAGKFKVFGEYYAEDLKGTSFDPKRATSWTMTVEIFNIPNRADLLQFYLDINRGGVVHSDDEITRVQGLLDEARAPAEAVHNSKRRKNNPAS